MLTRLSDIDRMFRTFDLLQNSIGGLLSDFDRAHRYGTGVTMDTGTPRTNLYDLGGKFEILVEVPGCLKEDLSVKIQGNYLELSGTRKADIPEGYSTHRHERVSGSFTRSFTLPADVNVDGVEATVTNGILRLSLPKSESAQPRQIKIS